MDEKPSAKTEDESNEDDHENYGIVWVHIENR